jgi:hypothetical protein
MSMISLLTRSSAERTSQISGFAWISTKYASLDSLHNQKYLSDIMGDWDIAEHTTHWRNRRFEVG